MSRGSDIRMHRRRRQRASSNSGAHVSSKPIIYWDEGRNKYTIATPYNAAFKDELKVVCFTAVWGGNTDKVWMVDASEVENAKLVVAKYYGEYDFIPKQEANFQTSVHIDSAATAALKIFKAAGKDASNKAFRALANEFHPDRNKAPGASDVMVEINSSWADLKKELGW